MATFNQVTLIGNCTRDPDLKKTAAGKTVCTFGLAVNDRYKNGAGEWVDEACFIDVTFFGGQADVAGEYLSKGSPVLVSGKLKMDSWEDKASGQRRSKHVVIGNTMQLLGQRGDRTSQDRPERSDEYSQAPRKAEKPAADEIPF